MITRREFVRAGACATLLAMCPPLCACSASATDRTVVIYSANEGDRNENLMAAMRRDLPGIDVRLKYMSTGNLAARLKTEGSDAECDMVLGMEAGYLLQAQEALVPLGDRFDLGVFEDDLRISDKIMPFTRECGCFAHNTDVLGKSSIEGPSSLEDLLDPRFAGKIAMPNPKASSTGYNFYYSMVNLLGEDGALAYFDELAKNVYQFTSSGGAPANALTRGEAGVGLSLVFQLANERTDGAPIELDMFPEGVPWTMNGIAVVQGHDERQAVWDVVRWFYEEGILLDKQAFVPDKVFKDQDTKIDGYPENITYANMEGLFDTERKERLLNAWKY